jgi:hypothetical protein
MVLTEPRTSAIMASEGRCSFAKIWRPLDPDCGGDDNISMRKSQGATNAAIDG